MNKMATYTIQNLLPLAIVLVVGVVGLTVGGDVIQNINEGQTTGSAADNISTDGLKGFMELSSWLPTIGLVVAAALIIGVLISAFNFGTPK